MAVCNTDERIQVTVNVFGGYRIKNRVDLVGYVPYGAHFLSICKSSRAR
jgi:hypothetical protein